MEKSQHHAALSTASEFYAVSFMSSSSISCLTRSTSYSCGEHITQRQASSHGGFGGEVYFLPYPSSELKGLFIYKQCIDELCYK
jgi:hypothetical protein